VVVGSLNADHVVNVDRFPAAGETVAGRAFAVFPGGKGANQACAAARLGARVAMIGAVGEDAYGELLAASLSAAGVDIGGVRRRTTAPTGVAIITIDAAGQNQIVLAGGANATVTREELTERRALFAHAAVVLVQQEIPLSAVEAAMTLGREAGARVILDPAPAVSDAARLLPLADYVTPNESELAILVGASRPAPSLDEAALQARRLLSLGARRVVAKLGERGALRVGAEGQAAWPGVPVSAVDTTAAGDVWNGAFATALAEGRSEDDAGGFANAAAALSVTRRGAQPSMPTRDQVETFRSATTDPKRSPQ
jgi:ribokinase